MILRKPYAFLIKHFKMLHILLSACIFYLIYRTGTMINYINNYVDNTISVVGDEIVGTLFNTGIFLLPILIIVFAGILLTIMTIKEKPRLFYIIVIIVEVAILLVYFYAYGVFSSMEETILDMRTIKALRDILFYVIIAQTGFSVFAVVRGVGFDIKKFNFGNDLQELEISAADNEEFEVALDFDLNDKKRAGRKVYRHIKYWILEHKKLFIISMSILIAIITAIICVDYAKNHKTYPQGKTLTMNGFSMTVNNSYLVSTDIKGNNITGDNAYLVVADLSIRCNENKPKTLKTGAIELNIAGDIYHHTDKYNYQLADLGNVYNNQAIGQDEKRYLLVYEIPATSSVSKMKIGFRDTLRKKTTYISLHLKQFKAKKTSKNYALGHTIDFSESTIGKSSLKITSYEIRNKFTLNYKYCSPRKRCVKSVEYLTPNLFNSNYNKSLLKLNADFKLDDSIASTEVYDFYTLMKMFAKIEYVIDDEVKYQNVYLGSIKSTKIKQENIYYIEVFQEIKIADSIAIIFTIRDREYKYYLKK